MPHKVGGLTVQRGHMGPGRREGAARAAVGHPGRR